MFIAIHGYKDVQWFSWLSTYFHGFSWLSTSSRIKLHCLTTVSWFASVAGGFSMGCNGYWWSPLMAEKHNGWWGSIVVYGSYWMMVQLMVFLQWLPMIKNDWWWMIMDWSGDYCSILILAHGGKTIWSLMAVVNAGLWWKTIVDDGSEECLLMGRNVWSDNSGWWCLPMSLWWCIPVDSGY